MAHRPASCFLALLCLVLPCSAGARREATPPPMVVNPDALRLAIEDLAQTFGPRYPNARAFLTRLDAIDRQPAAARQAALRALQRDALLANPLLDLPGLLVVRRKCTNGWDCGFPTNHECNSSLKRTGYDNEIAVINVPSPLGGGMGWGTPGGQTATSRTLFRPKGGSYVGEIDLHPDGDRLLFTQSDPVNWKVWEVRVDTSAGSVQAAGRRQVSQMPDDVDAFDPCYLPDGNIVFGSTASFQSVPCWHGQKWVSNLYVMGADGSGVRQVCFDQDHDFHPVVLASGQVLYHRWDYTGINHIFMRQLMVMNPDGTGQRAVYGSNSWYPNALYFPRELPGQPGKLACILSGYHGAHRMGQFVLLDTRRGSYERDGIVQRISGRGDPVDPRVADILIDKDWPKFLHPWPLSSKHFLVACWPGGSAPWGIYLADVYDNLVLLHEEQGTALLEPVPLKPRPSPPVIAGRMDLARQDGVVYLHDVYAGPGLAGVPKGTVKSLRVLAYHFGYRHLAGPDKVGYGGPWEAMRILGTVPLDDDGSVTFRAPANTPLAVQALDAEGKAVQLMRSWFTLMPGEHTSCVGCHEQTRDAVPTRLATAARKPPLDITPWHGPARGFDFEREAQPVLDRYCVACHNGSTSLTTGGSKEAGSVARAATDTYPLKRSTGSELEPVGAALPDLRAERFVKGYQGQQLSKLGSGRMHPKLKAATGGRIRYTPAYDALLPYIRRVSIEDDVSLLVPGEYHADTSELVQMLRAGHYGVTLDAESWDRLVTWIDLNAPCHGTWGDVHAFPTDAKVRRAALRKLYGGPPDDPEAVPELEPRDVTPVKPQSVPDPKPVKVEGWPFSAQEATKRQTGVPRVVNLGNGIGLDLVSVPAGEFVMGSGHDSLDEGPPAAVKIARPFWMSRCEVTNEQFRRFDSSFDPRYYARLHARSDDQGLPLNAAAQPAVRVSWHQAMAYCAWLSERTGRPFTLPTEAQWEWACRSGTDTPLNYGEFDADFSKHANVADRAYADVKNVTGGLAHLIIHGQALCDARFSDGHRVTAPVGSYQPNAWGLHDLHGNIAEWTLSLYRPYPYADDGRDDPSVDELRVVRGGSFFDRPKRCRSSARLPYPPWQRVFNVGFRVVCIEDPTVPKRARR